MMKSVSGVVCYVKDAAKTADFYEKLGFTFKKREADYVSVRLNWFWIDFVPADTEQKPEFKKEATAEKKGTGMFLYISVDDVDAFYQALLDKGLQPSSEPRDWPVGLPDGRQGNREFVIRDPDGYKLVFFKKK